MNSFLFTLVEVLAVLVVISISFPFFAVVILPLAVLYYVLLRIYIPASRQIKRFESATRSPINLHFSESVQGAQVIRAFGERERFVSESEALVQSNLRHQYAASMCKRWLSLRSELTGNAVVLLAAVLAVAQRHQVTAGWVGLAVSFAMSVTETFNWVLVNGSSVEEKAVSVERIRETEKYTPVEGEWRRPGTDPDPDPDPEGGGERWLKDGRIRMENLTLSYARDLPAVLHGLTLTISPGEKVGVCGRTGAGKSSLVSALFNLVESWSGKIELDGVDIRKIGLHTLRCMSKCFLNRCAGYLVYYST